MHILCHYHGMVLCMLELPRHAWLQLHVHCMQISWASFSLSQAKRTKRTQANKSYSCVTFVTFLKNVLLIDEILKLEMFLHSHCVSTVLQSFERKCHLWWLIVFTMCNKDYSLSERKCCWQKCGISVACVYMLALFLVRTRISMPVTLWTHNGMNAHPQIVIVCPEACTLLILVWFICNSWMNCSLHMQYMSGWNHFYHTSIDM